MSLNISILKNLSSQNIHTSRSLPENVPGLHHTWGARRIVTIAYEALPLVSMISPQLAYKGNLAGLTIAALGSLKNNHKLYAILTAATAYAFYVNPMDTSQVLHSASGVVSVANSISYLAQGNFKQASYSLLKAGSEIVYVGVLATGNPQFVAISLVAQAVSSFNRASYYCSQGRNVEALTNFAIGQIAAFTAYDQRANLFVPAAKYEAAFTEMKVWATKKTNQLVDTASQITAKDVQKWSSQYTEICKAKLSNVTAQDIKDWTVQKTEACKTTLSNITFHDVKDWSLAQLDKFVATFNAALKDLYQSN